ncbi:MAG: galactosyltransferase-related protein, partial [Cyclobacteriaceae bacterium]|nr:galactosyltransferase-related protein [Cyclobacteriaceae bacterium]
RDTKPYGLFLKPTTLTSMLRSFYRLVHKPLPIHFLKSGIKIIYPEWVSGSAIMISKKLFDEIGGWSEDFWMYYEDADLCKRVTNLGGKVALLTNVQIIHNHGGSSRINFEVKALTKSEVIISKHVYINKYFTGIKHFVMQASLVFSNLLLDSLFMALIGLLFFFKPSLRVYMRVYANTITYYKGVIANETWLSPRSTNFRKE